MKNERSCKWGFLLYPDNPDHMSTFQKLQLSDGVSLSLAYCLHDKDIYREDVLKDNQIIHSAGEVKKAHYHVVASFPNQVWMLGVCKEFVHDPHFIQRIRNYDNALLYLIHYRDPDKFNYELSDVHGSLAQKLREVASRDDKSEGERVQEVFAFIESSGHLRVMDLSLWCATNGFWDVFRRSAYIFITCLNDHNSIFIQNNDSDSNNINFNSNNNNNII